MYYVINIIYVVHLFCVWDMWIDEIVKWNVRFLNIEFSQTGFALWYQKKSQGAILCIRGGRDWRTSIYTDIDNIEVAEYLQ